VIRQPAATKPTRAAGKITANPVLGTLNTLGKTAQWTAAIRGRESDRPDRLFSDPLAHALAGEDGWRMLGSDDSQLASVGSYVAIRTRFFDDFALRAIQTGIRQVVMLAAGMDARAFRLPWPAGTTMYEIDRSELLHAKKEILDRENAMPQCRRVSVEADLETDWIVPLSAAGFESGDRALWLAEGVFFYLETHVVQSILERLSTLAAAGSWLGCDFVSQAFLTSPWMSEALATMASRGMAWRSATDEPEALLGAFGWETEVKQPGEPGVSPERWPYPVMQRVFRQVPRSFLVSARRK
jgi:methyltransferase (TIGR00027 family)